MNGNRPFTYDGVQYDSIQNASQAQKAPPSERASFSTVMPSDAAAMMHSVTANAESMVEVAAAYMEQCEAVESFFDSFQEKLQNRTLYVLTIATVVIMPTQLMTVRHGCCILAVAAASRA